MCVLEGPDRWAEGGVAVTKDHQTYTESVKKAMTDRHDAHRGQDLNDFGVVCEILLGSGRNAVTV